MRRTPFKAKRDASETDIVIALRDVGAEVWSLDTPCDLVIAFRGRWHMIEVKENAEKAARLTDAAPTVKLTGTEQSQRQHIERAGYANCIIHVVYTPDMALRAIGAIA